MVISAYFGPGIISLFYYRFPHTPIKFSILHLFIVFYDHTLLRFYDLCVCISTRTYLPTYVNVINILSIVLALFASFYDIWIPFSSSLLGIWWVFNFVLDFIWKLQSSLRSYYSVRTSFFFHSFIHPSFFFLYTF